MNSRRTALLAFASLAATSVLTFTGGPSASAATPTASGSYVSVTPSRVLDTRYGTGVRRGAIAARTLIASRIGGRAGVPSSGVAAVAVTFTVASPTATGAITAWASGTSRPAAVNVSFTRGRAASGLAVVPVSASGALDIYNASSGTVQVIADISGYYLAGTPTATGSYHPLRAARVVDTRTGLYGNGSGAVRAEHGLSPLIGGRAGVPTSGVSAVVVTITAMYPSRSGHLLAYPQGTSRPADAALQFLAGQTSSALAIVPVTNGRISLFNYSAGTVHLAVDVSGYLLSGTPTTAGTFLPLATQRILDTKTGLAGNRYGALAAGQAVSVQVGGKAGMPITGVAAVVTITDVSPSRSGGITAWRPGTARPVATDLQFGAGQMTSDVVIVPLASNGTVDLYNASSGSTQVVAAVDGFVLADPATPPAASTSRYVRNISDGGTADVAAMRAEGCADAQRGSTFVLLDIGAQLNDQSGVALTVVNTRVTYGALVGALDGYVAGFASCRSGNARIALGTNNGADFAVYSAGARGKDWADSVVDPVAASAPAGVEVLGADDIEGAFASTEAQAEQWESAFLASTGADLVFNGSADGCPSTYGLRGLTCSFGWTQADYYRLAGGLNPSRLQALPQIYYDYQARQWANIDAGGGGHIRFAGSLTEYASACGTDCAMTPGQGWAALYLALRSVLAAPSLPAAADLRVDG